MIVSSHTLSIWTGWNTVPRDIQNEFTNRLDIDLILFVPKVMESDLKVGIILKVFEAAESKQLTYGMVYVRRGE